MSLDECTHRTVYTVKWWDVCFLHSILRNYPLSYSISTPSSSWYYRWAEWDQGHYRGEWTGIPQAVCWETALCRGSQCTHLLPLWLWWRLPETVPKGDESYHIKTLSNRHARFPYQFNSVVKELNVSPCTSDLIRVFFLSAMACMGIHLLAISLWLICIYTAASCCLFLMDSLAHVSTVYLVHVSVYYVYILPIWHKEKAAI